MLMTYCNVCSKVFTETDEYDGGKIVSNNNDIVLIDLCSDCFQKLVASISPQCKIEPSAIEYDEYDMSEDDSSDYDYDGELN